MAEDFFKRFDNEMQRRHPEAYAAQASAQAAAAEGAAAAAAPAEAKKGGVAPWVGGRCGGGAGAVPGHALNHGCACHFRPAHESAHLVAGA